MTESSPQHFIISNAQSAYKGLKDNLDDKDNQDSGLSGSISRGPAPFTLKWYFNLYSLNWFLSAQIIAASVLVQIFTFSLPLFYMVIFDRVFGKQNLAALNVMAAGMILVIVFDLLVKSFRSYILCYQTELADKLSIEAFLNRLFNLPLNALSSNQKKLFAGQFGDLIKINRILTTSLLISWVEILFSIAVLIFITSIDLRLGMIASAPLIPISAIIFFSSPRIQKRALVFEKDQKECQMKLAEIIESLETVKSSNSSLFLKVNVAKKIEQTLHDGFQSRYDNSNGGNVIGFIGTLGSVALLYFGALEVLKGEVTSGVYISINMLSRTMIASFQRLFYSVISFEEAFNTLSQVKQVTGGDHQTESNNKAVLAKNSIKGEIQVEELYFKYQTDLPWSLKNINLVIKAGEKVVFTGRSGCGKSTLGRLMQCLYHPNSGSISLDGRNILDLPTHSLREAVGLIQQRPCIFSGTIKDNILMGNISASEQQINEAIEIAGLQELLRKLPSGLDTEVSLLGANIALDQAARISIARSVLIEPQVLILDDSIPYLDALSQTEIYNRLFIKFQNKTCIFVTNYLPLHKKADRIFVMHEGQVIESGSYQELISKDGLYAKAFAIKAKV
ncbi:MAG: ATP-binding cassette domain-containing protein [Candidatus Caenarcaniphilales bacterium]|nr:ATP-binding cassette domain-containing protein [Candidatus Caenarcaniphilales bacterium]